MGPDLVLGHAHQACCDGHLLLRISRKILCSGNGLLDRGRLIAHPWWTGELGRLGLGAHMRGHDRTIPDHVVFVQRSKSRAGLQHGWNPARPDPEVREMRPGVLEGSGPLCQMLSKVLVHLEHGHTVLPNTAWSFSSAMISRLFCVITHPPHRNVFMLSNQQLTPISSRCRLVSNRGRDTSRAASREAGLIASSGTLLA